jgi:hypothetical protein
VTWGAGYHPKLPAYPIRLMVKMFDSQSNDKGSIPLWDTDSLALAGGIQMN